MATTRQLFFLSMIGLVVLCSVVRGDDNPDSKPTSRTTRSVVGWNVHIDDRLLAEQSDLGTRALKLLESRLDDIVLQLPPAAVAKLQRVAIYIDLSHGKLAAAQYHPSREWLVANGYSPELTKSVHFPVAEWFASQAVQQVQPWMVFHELAHAYHDQFLPKGFRNPELSAAWKKGVDEGKYANVLHINGHHTKHYALTDPMEFFAEMSEAYWGRNDFYPFVRGELQADNPEVARLIAALWQRDDKPTSNPTSWTTRSIVGWNVHIDDRLLTEQSDLSARALKLLESRLDDIVLQLPPAAVAKLQQVAIYLDLSHGDLNVARYHPGSAWLVENGYSPEPARAVHFPVAEWFASQATQRVQPGVVFHELAHAYHDQFLPDGFGNTEISAAWKKSVDEGKYANVLHINGDHTKHYALTDPTEFFAEMSEAYWDRNDFYPFVRGELQEDNPEVARLIATLWQRDDARNER